MDADYGCTMTQMSKRDLSHSMPEGCCQGLADLLSPLFFKALCDPNRLMILCRLGGECCAARTVTQIAECCPINVSVVSRHLAMLRDAGILKAEKRGKEVYYSIRTDPLVSTFRAIADAVEACCPEEGQTDSNARKRRESRQGD